MSEFRAKTTYDGFEWTIKIAVPKEGYLATGSGLTAEAAHEAAMAALKQKYLDDGKPVPERLAS